MTEPRASFPVPDTGAAQLWATHHCTICGIELDDRQIELMVKMVDDHLTDAEQAELDEMDCPRGCWAAEEAAQALADQIEGR